MIRIRPYTLADIEALIAIQAACFPPPFPSELWWKPEQIAAHVRIFPAGALCAVNAAGELVGSATAHIIHMNTAHAQHTWSAASADGWLTNHDPAGDTLYGVDIAVVPSWRGRGVAKALYGERFALVKRLGLARFIAGSRISGYKDHRHLTPEAYVAAVIAGKIPDPVITPQLRAGLQPQSLVHDYLPDADAADCALLMEWRNPQLTKTSNGSAS